MESKAPSSEKLLSSSTVMDVSNSGYIRTIVGGFTLFLVIVTWISSLASPLIFLWAILNEKYTLVAIIVLLVTMAYVPWEKGPVSRFFSAMINYHPYYYKRCSTIFDGSLPDATDKPKFYAVHPHGAFCLGWSVIFAAPYMSNVRFCFSPVLYASPFFQLLCRLIGNPGKADKASMIKYMKKGEHLALPPGGFEEATISSTSHDRVYIKKRVGFIKLCLQHGYSVVPVYAFGEKYTYSNVQGMWKARLFLNSLGVPAIAVWGASFLPLLPKRHKHGLIVAAGKPLDLPKIENPTRDEVKVWHDKYIASLEKLFEDHKVNAYGEEGKALKLELW